MKRAKPDFFIVGAPKCGTSSLCSYLHQHPQIFLPKQKEINYFGADLQFRNFRMSEGEYLDFFKKARTDQIVGTVSVWALFSEQAAQEIKEFNPKAKIIVMLRNPVQLIHSLYYQLRFSGEEDLPTLAEALDAEPDRLAGARIPHAAYAIHGLQYFAVPRFTSQLRRYFDVFGRERVHVVIFDDFKSDTPACYRKVLEFLNVETGFQPSFEVVNTNKKVKSELLAKLLRKHPEALQGIARRLVPVKAVRRRIRRSLRNIDRKINISKYKRPSLPLATQRRLEREFHGEIHALGKLLQRDLSDWLGSTLGR